MPLAQDRRLRLVFGASEVIEMEPERRLTPVFGMRAPGAGYWNSIWRPHTRLPATAYWHPAGVWGLMYWLSTEPFPQVIFSGLTREICRRAEARHLGQPESH